jgi:histidinol phosphatase-like enzyme (inositol monophosphatase family)
MPTDYQQELDLAVSLIRAAGQTALAFQRDGFDVEDKPDDSPVTAADKACELLMASAIRERFPEDGLLGEEGASEPPVSGRRWIIDPIDGTRDFVRGNRLWANFIAMEAEGEVKVGACGFPALGEIYWAARGHGAWREFEGVQARLQASSISEVSRAVLCGNFVAKLADFPDRERFLTFADQFWSARCLGGAWDVMQLAAGRMDLWIEPSAKPWDFAPLQVIAEESGAKYFTFSGSRSIYEGSAVICAPGLESAARAAMSITG